MGGRDIAGRGANVIELPRYHDSEAATLAAAVRGLMLYRVKRRTLGRWQDILTKDPGYRDQVAALRRFGERLHKVGGPPLVRHALRRIERDLGPLGAEIVRIACGGMDGLEPANEGRSS